MTAKTFDTHTAVKELQSAGAAPPLAEAMVKTVGDALSGHGEQAATKADLAITKSELQKNMETLKKNMETLKLQMMFWNAALAAIIIAVLKS